MRHVNVVAGIVIKDGLILCAKRKPGGETGGQYEFPGGKIEEGEDQISALIRELKEELNLSVADIAFYKHIYYAYQTFTIDLYFYLCRPVSSFEIREHLEVGYYEIAELKKLNFAPADAEVINDLSQKKGLENYGAY